MCSASTVMPASVQYMHGVLFGPFKTGQCMQTAVQYLEDEQQMQKLYWQRAQAYRAASQFPAAERTLLAIRRWDAAAEMYKAASMYGDYLRLLKQRPEQLPAAQAWVAQELEASGHLRYDQPGLAVTGSSFGAWRPGVSRVLVAARTGFRGCSWQSHVSHCLTQHAVDAVTSSHNYCVCGQPWRLLPCSG